MFKLINKVKIRGNKVLPLALSRMNFRRKVHLSFSPPGSTEEFHQKAVLLQISGFSSSSLEALVLLDAGLYSNLGGKKKEKKRKKKESNLKKIDERTEKKNLCYPEPYLTLQPPNFNIVLTSVGQVPFLHQVYTYMPTSVRAVAKGLTLSMPF